MIDLYVDDCLFERESAVTGGGSINAFDGLFFNPSVVVERSKFIECSVTGVGVKVGGAIGFLRVKDGKIFDTMFLRCSAASGKGGAIFILRGLITIIENCTFVSNSADDGGGMYVDNTEFSTLQISVNISSSTFHDNFALGTSSNGNGGSIHVDGSVFLGLHTCTFVNETAKGRGGLI